MKNQIEITESDTNVLKRVLSILKGEDENDGYVVQDFENIIKYLESNHE